MNKMIQRTLAGALILATVLTFMIGPVSEVNASAMQMPKVQNQQLQKALNENIVVTTDSNGVAHYSMDFSKLSANEYETLSVVAKLTQMPLGNAYSRRM